MAVAARRDGGAPVDRASPPLLVRNLPPGAIPALDRPRLVPARDARLPASTAVVGVALGGDARAYPVDLVALHEIVNDRVGGRPVTITWCPLCRTAVGFSRRIGDRTLTFRVSGLLRSRNLVMVDRETRSLWPQIDGRAVRGPLRGRRLGRVVVTHTSLEQWRREHPDSVVLPVEGSRFEARLRSDGLWMTQYGAEEGRPHETDARLYDGGKRLDATVSYWFAWAAFHPDARLVASNID